MSSQAVNPPLGSPPGRLEIKKSDYWALAALLLVISLAFDVRQSNTVSSISSTTGHAILKNHTMSVETPPSTVFSYLQEYFPECVAPSTLPQPLNLSQVGRYQKVPTPSDPPYNHLNCFVMKARYNCAFRPNATFAKASEYELVLDWSLAGGTGVCRVGQLFDTLRKGKQDMTMAKFLKLGSPHQDPVRVIFQGNSYVRQFWEALVCGIGGKPVFRSPSRSTHLTRLQVQEGGPGISMSDFMARRQRNKESNGSQSEFVSMDELGDPLTNITELRKVGCHGDSTSDISQYYRKYVRTPNNLANCNDNLAMVELEESIEFYYIFKPTMYELDTLQYIYDEYLGITKQANRDEKRVNATLVWNYVTKEAQNDTFSEIADVVVNSSSNGRYIEIERQLKVEDWLWTMRRLQDRDLGRYFGANNPWITNPPDFHPCMPGIPDDEIHLLIYLLGTGYDLVT